MIVHAIATNSHLLLEQIIFTILHCICHLLIEDESFLFGSTDGDGIHS